jgi:hypothetical protein
MNMGLEDGINVLKIARWTLSKIVSVGGRTGTGHCGFWATGKVFWKGVVPL